MPAPGVFVTRKNISIRIERLLRTGRAIGSSIAPSVAGSRRRVALVAVFIVLRTMTPSIAFTAAGRAATCRCMGNNGACRGSRNAFCGTCG